jgi:hypothetical protein
MHRDKLLAWVQDVKVAPSRRRLYLTMLGICGTPEDAKKLESMIRSNDKQAKLSLDALVAAYLTLEGPSGINLWRFESMDKRKKSSGVRDCSKRCDTSSIVRNWPIW